ncbi:MAG: helix-turn-helix domain-containing protein [Chloroflexota bacterium]
MQDQPITLGEYIRRRRRAKRWSVRQLADQARLSYFYVSKLENDQQEPALDALIKLAEALDDSENEPPLGRMLELSKAESAVILERLLDRHRWSGSFAAARRSGAEVSEEERLLAELKDWPPALRSALAGFAGAPEDDVASLAQAMDSLIRLSPDERRRWAEFIAGFPRPGGGAQQ